MIHITDHLGSVRAVVDGLTGQTAETNDYYPFGSRWEDEDGISDPTNRYRFNGKEDQEGEFGVPTLDYGARHYTPSTARWLSMDPLSEKYYGVSPYAFCNNDPVNFVDLDGRFPDLIWDIASIGMGVRSLAQNVKAGNVRAAIGDGFGIAVDAFAAALPIIPGGVGALRHGVKAVNMLDAGTDFLRLTGELQGFEKAADMPSIVLTKEEHQKFTAAWRQAIGYDKSGATIETSSANKEEILHAARDIYKDYPELLKVIEEAFK